MNTTTSVFSLDSFLAAKVVAPQEQGTPAIGKQYNYRGMLVPDPAAIILAKGGGEAGFYNYVDCWLQYEFNLPLSLRELCRSSLLRVMTADMYTTALRNNRNTFAFGGKLYALHEQSHPTVIESAPLIAVSLREFGDDLFAVSHVWAVKATDGSNF